MKTDFKKLSLCSIVVLCVFCGRATVNLATSDSDPDNYNGHEYVDLGLPSGLKWATCNVGANTPEEYGYYFAWGETKPKASYDDKNSETYRKEDDWLRSNGYIDSRGNLSAAHDAATVNWGATWRMPTNQEIEELTDNCTTEWTKENGVYGRLITSKNNGKTIFLPATGYLDGTWHDGAEENGTYWSSTPNSSDKQYGSHNARILYFFSNNLFADWMARFYGYCVRPVAE